MRVLYLKFVIIKAIGKIEKNFYVANAQFTDHLRGSNMAGIQIILASFYFTFYILVLK